MSIKLSFYIDKKRIKLKDFCSQFEIKSYNELIEYCKSKNINCDISKSNCDDVFTEQKEVKNEIKNTKSSEKPQTRRRGRKRKTEKSGNVNKKSDS